MPALARTLVHERTRARIHTCPPHSDNATPPPGGPLQAWLALICTEVITRSPGAVVQATFERAVTHDTGRTCPLLWRCYLRFEGYRGRQDALRRCGAEWLGV